MGSYRIEWRYSAAKELKKLPKEAIERVLNAVQLLGDNPYGPGARKLTNSERTFRIRVGVYRVVYEVFERTLVVEIVRVGHRKDIYRGK